MTIPSFLPTPLEWRNSNYLISTSSSLLDHAAINAAFASDHLPWTRALDPETLSRLLSLSLCYGVYETCSYPSLSSPTASPSLETKPQEPPHPQLKQIGFARLVTDTLTHAYLTDVYILPAYTRRGLATWLMACVDDTIRSWPDLRRFALFASGGKAKAFYRDPLGMKAVKRGRGELDDACEFLMWPQPREVGDYEFLAVGPGVDRVG